MSLTSKLDAYIRDKKSGECWEIEGSDEEDRKVYVAVPREILNLHDSLADIAEEFGAPCDLHLTDTGALLVFWLPASWQRPLPIKAPGWKPWLLSALLVVLASAIVVAVPLHQNANGTTDGGKPNGSGAGGWGWSIW